MEVSKSAADRAIRHQIGLASLSPERERHLLRIVHASGDERQRQAALIELWESHSKLVIAIANRYRTGNIDLLDLVGAGHLGLHAAIDRFNPEQFDNRLSTYAVGWIRCFIQDYIRRNAGPVRLPSSTAHRQLVRLRGRLVADARLSCQRERVEPSDSEVYERIGRRIGLTGDEVACSMRLMQGGSVSLHADPGSDTNLPRLEDTLPDHTACSEDDVILRLDHAKARKRIVSLTQEILGERERAVFLARCMRDTDEIAHLDSLAQQFGVSRERIYQLEASAKRKIATALAREGYSEFAHPGANFRLPPVRAPRRGSSLPLRKSLPHPQRAAHP